MSNYLIFLGVGHLLGDFYFQGHIMTGERDQKLSGVFGRALEYYLLGTLVSTLCVILCRILILPQ